MDAVAAELKVKLESLAKVFEEKSAEIMLKVRELKQAGDDQKKRILAELKVLRASLKETWGEWVELTGQVARQYQLSH